MQTLMYDLVRRHQLSPTQAQQLWRCAGLGHPPPDWPQRLWRTLTLIAALLLGAGLIFWVAAQWPEQTRQAKLTILQAAVLLPALLAAAWPRGRQPALLLATLALGGLLAFVGQTYQTGADAWQLFAAWAALALAWTLLARSDGLWALWLLIAGAGLGLWSGPLLEQPVLSLLGRSQRYAQTLLLWLPLWALPQWLPRLPGCAVAQPRISQALAAALALAAWTGYGLWALFGTPDALLCALVAALLALVLWQARRQRHGLVLAMGLLAANVLWLAALGKLLSHWQLGDRVALFLIMSVVVAVSVGASAHWLYRQQQHQEQA